MSKNLDLLLNIKFIVNKIIPRSPVIWPKLVIVELKSKNLEDIGSKKNQRIIGIALNITIKNIEKFFFKFFTVKV